MDGDDTTPRPDESESAVDEPTGPHPPAAVRAAVGAVLDDAVPGAVEYLPAGKNDAYLVGIERDAGRERVVLKAATRSNGRVLRAEARALEAVDRQTAVPVPSVLGVEASAPSLDDAYVVMTAADGVRARGDDLAPGVLERLCREAGRHLADLHDSFGFASFGRLEPDERDGLVVAEPFDGWPGMFRSIAARTVGRLGGTRFADLAEPVSESLDAAASDLAGPFRAVLVHNDYRPENLAVAPEAVDAPSWDVDRRVTRAVLDWENPFTAPPAFELANVGAVLVDRAYTPPALRPRLRAALSEGYRRVRPLPAGGRPPECYRLAARVRLLANFREEMTGSSESERDARAAEHRSVLREEFGVVS